MLNVRDDGCRIYQACLRRTGAGSKGQAGEATAEFRDVVARDEREARLLISERYPAADGFVIDAISPVG